MATETALPCGCVWPRDLCDEGERLARAWERSYAAAQVVNHVVLWERVRRARLAFEEHLRGEGANT